MRINQFVALASGLSRRAADRLISDGRVAVNGRAAQLGQNVIAEDQIQLDQQTLKLPNHTLTIILNKPSGYVVSRNGQGSPTIYTLLPPDLQKLKPVGRLDKDSSGLLLLTSDGKLANKLLHPSFIKNKVYRLTISKPLLETDKRHIEEGVILDDGPSALKLSGQGRKWTVEMHEGRNRQIRRTFQGLGYQVLDLHRISFGAYRIGNLSTGNWQFTQKTDII